jgi:hypothetical protein
MEKCFSIRPGGARVLDQGEQAAAVQTIRWIRPRNFGKGRENVDVSSQTVNIDAGLEIVRASA